MTPISISRGKNGGFETVAINTGALHLVLVPELGGKVSSLRDARTGREWLWRNPRLPYRRVPHGSSYTRLADTGGWDECFPTVSECAYPSPPWTGATVQDHGELWNQAVPLEIREQGNSALLTTVWQGIVLPYTFERTITAHAGSATLQFAYTVKNNSTEPLDWIWSAHALLAIEPGMQLVVPPSARFNLGGSMPPRLLEQHNNLPFPLQVGTYDLQALPPVNAGIALKLWSAPLTKGWATLRARDGEFQLRWNVTRLPQVGIWLNLGAWAGDGGAPYYNLGLEPCIGAQDSLNDAVTQYRLFERLEAGASYAWSLEVELTTLPLDWK